MASKVKFFEGTKETTEKAVNDFLAGLGDVESKVKHEVLPGSPAFWTAMVKYDE